MSHGVQSASLCFGQAVSQAPAWPPRKIIILFVLLPGEKNESQKSTLTTCSTHQLLIAAFLLCVASGEHHFKMSIWKKWKKHTSCTSHSLYHNSSTCLLPSSSSTALHYWWDFLWRPHLPLCWLYSPVGSRCGCTRGTADATRGKIRQGSDTLTAYWQGAIQRACYAAGLLLA